MILIDKYCGKNLITDRHDHLGDKVIEAIKWSDFGETFAGSRGHA